MSKSLFSFMSLSEEIPFSKMRNFRDMGGYVTESGKKVKYGLLFRGPSLSSLETKEDFDKFYGLGIKSIIDLRSPGEVAMTPDPEFKGIKHQVIDAIQLCSGSKSTDFNFESRERFEAALDLFAHRNAELPFKNPAYQAIFDDMINGTVPLYFHCYAGKDRTGLAAMLILTLLGVKYEDAMQDYLASNKYIQGIIEKTAKELAIKYPPNCEDLVQRLCGVDRRNIDIAFEEINKKYKSFDEFLLDNYGITPEIKSKLREKYLE